MLQCGRFELNMRQAHIMAIINLTPDSFSGDGLGKCFDAALRQAETAVSQGATLLDVGGESSRPGADPVSLQEELARVIPAVERLTSLGVAVSVDTVKPEVMRAAIAAGADMINDINGFEADGAVETVAGSHAALCVMHMQGHPRGMQHAPRYDDVVTEISSYLRTRAKRLVQSGVASSRIVLDPGFGFGKTVEHNYTLLHRLEELVGESYPLLVGLSRKSMLAAVTGNPPPAQRQVASVVAAVIAVQNGARIVRVHDVAATRDGLAVWQACARA